MCGISGSIGTLDSDIIKALKKIDETHSHRGPDDSGFWCFYNEHNRSGVALAHRRLAIIDLSERAHQPMIDEKSGAVIVFNGEIYNYRTLRNQLVSIGVTFQSGSDSEVLLKCYIQWGSSCVSRLRGMFACAIWDFRKRELVLFRDRVGIKPLYFAEVDIPNGERTIFFASEVRSLLASGLIERKLDPVGLSTYLWNGFVVGPATIIKGIRCLLPGTMMTISLDTLGARSERYWQIPGAYSGGLSQEEFECELGSAVQQHLVSDVPLGLFLSGGIDSSALAVLAVESANEQVKTFTVGFEEIEYSELPYARAVSQALGTQHSEIVLTEQSFKQELSLALRALDQPTFDGINSYFVSRAVREAGVTVALAGTGGDELFGGYKSFVDIPRVLWLTKCMSLFPQNAFRSASYFLVGLINRQKGQVSPQGRWGKLGDVLAAENNMVRIYQIAYGLFTEDFISQMIAEDAATAHFGLQLSRAEELSGLIRNDPVLHAISTLELSCFIGERLLRDTDCVSMAVGLEVRVPYLDHEVINIVAGMAANKRFYPLRTKPPLRRIIYRHLNPDLFSRPKTGFTFPFKNWCRQGLKAELAATLLDSSLCESVGMKSELVRKLWKSFEAQAHGLYWDRIWALFVLLWWCRQYRVTNY